MSGLPEIAPTSLRTRLSRGLVVRVVLGCFLLTAAALKGHALLTGSGPSIASFSSPHWEFALIEVEILLGLWLLIGKWARPAWVAALAFFSIVAGASLYMALDGQSSCGCFGRVQASPWLTFALDSAAVVALLISRPGRTAASRPADCWPQGLLTTAAGAVVLSGLFVGGAFLFLSDNPPESLVRLRGDIITAEPTVSDIGRGAAGERRSLTIRLMNHGDQPVRIIGGTANCSCIATGDLPLTIAPGEAQVMGVRVIFRGTTGRFRQWFVLYTDDRRQPTVIAWFAGRVTGGPTLAQDKETAGR